MAGDSRDSCYPNNAGNTLKDITYRCDLCNDLLLHGEDLDDTRCPFVAYSFSGASPAKQFVAVEPGAAEHHLCHACLAGLVSLAVRELPEGLLASLVGTSKPPDVAGPDPYVGAACCLCQKSLDGHAGRIVHFDDRGDAHLRCWEAAAVFSAKFPANLGDGPTPAFDSVEAARRCQRCRICGAVISGPWTYDSGKEYAHTACLEKAKETS